MSYEALKTFNLDDGFEGWVIIKRVKDRPPKIERSTLYTVDELDELNQHLRELVANESVTDHWPDANDPDVVSLLADSSFEPPATVEQQVIDEEKSNIVTISTLTGKEIDFDASDLVYKTIEAPLPSAEFERLHKASEVVAKRRAGV